MITISEAQKNAQFSKIQVEHKLMEKEGLKMLGAIVNQMYTSCQESFIDASFYRRTDIISSFAKSSLILTPPSREEK